MAKAKRGAVRSPGAARCICGLQRRFKPQLFLDERSWLKLEAGVLPASVRPRDAKTVRRLFKELNVHIDPRISGGELRLVLWEDS